ncbi:MAG: SAM-dependent DNA methyltransferase [Ktedonobacteraceae bacterium]|nr:SAM-dependent DNA methyltransferase [Ktedonobacteraceae bacterium]
MTSKESQDIVRRLWRYCDILRDDGVSYGDYVEQLTYLLFLKMADERTQPPYNEPSSIPDEYNWQSLKRYEGKALEEHYEKTLKTLGEQKGMLSTIFLEAKNKIKNPAKLRRLIVELIDTINWTGKGTDVKGDAYEGLLQKNAEDKKSGAGQYFTPRPLIEAIVEVMRPDKNQRICDPACGTGGFLLAAHKYIQNNRRLNVEEKEYLKKRSLYGWELVPDTARLCVMNLFLHGIGDETSERGPITINDSLLSKPEEPFDIVLSNPPFGRKTEGGASAYSRRDFWTETSNKQLNFVQHIFTLLDVGGRAAVVVPDNVLFEGGAGQKIRDNLLRKCDVHTLLRLPTGIFYAQGVKANVLFFDKKSGSATAHTKELWIYDLRTNKNFTMRTNPLKAEDLEDFISCYHAENRYERERSERFQSYSYEQLLERDKLSLDIFWLRDESQESADEIPSLEELTVKIIEDLEDALEQFKAVAEDLGIPVNGAL